MPPKNIISVSKKSHMPKVEVSFCCSRFAKWCRRYGECSCSACASGWVAIAWLSNGLHLMFGLVCQPLVVVGFVVDHRRLDKVFRQRRRLYLPLQPRCLPGIRPRDLAVLERPSQVEQRKHVTHS